MKTFCLTLILVAVWMFPVGSANMSAKSASAPAAGMNDMSPATLKELARARAATARFHDIAQAEAEGYINVNFCEPGEGCHWVKPSLIDASFDAQQPEILLYVPGSGNSDWRLVAVEYIVPLTLSPGAPPAGFSGIADVWRENSEGAGDWELTAWIWLSNPNGIFEQHNPKVP